MESKVYSTWQTHNILTEFEKNTAKLLQSNAADDSRLPEMKLRRSKSELEMPSLSKAGAVPCLERVNSENWVHSSHFFQTPSVLFCEAVEHTEERGVEMRVLALFVRMPRTFGSPWECRQGVWERARKPHVQPPGRSPRARSVINPSRGGCLWGVTVLAQQPLMDAHQAAVFGPMCWICEPLCSPGPGQDPNAGCGPSLSGTLPRHSFMFVPTL